MLNGANEAAVGLFLEDKIAFPDIYRLVKSAVDRISFVQDPDLEEILTADRLARQAVLESM